MQRSLRLRHVHGLPNTEAFKSVVLRVQSDGILFSTDQKLPYKRIQGCDLYQSVIKAPGSPTGEAVSYGIILFLLGAFLGGTVADLPAIGVLSGLIGIIVGAIKGTQVSEKNYTILSVQYNSIHGSPSVIQLALAQKNARKTLIDIARHINHSVGCTLPFTDPHSRKPYEI
ncbi:hypothetical protein DCC85_12180 [Paenibacillus sp. CAA11]|uniref:hypothetical protein n=1 Tax=Paenibacillus sp. CAA11 TaxID=1532905 RepID=UPI000D35F82F|nr:hypothetical protein [Paenibacillus sp. CAA11]AWB44903.1 hypothetical protein DCC85_12180 [Paenibacillus sp. CAA11]